MRTITTAQQAVLDSGVQADHVRVSIKDGGGTFRDLTTYPGFNAVRMVSWSERVDDPHMTCDISLVREMYKLSLAPLMTGSAINKGFDPAASSVALIAQNRELKIEVAVVPMDKQPTSGDWMEVFRGRVDSIDTASAFDVKVGCRSLGGRLAQQFIKTELVYSFAAVAGVAKPLRIWEPQIAVVNNVTYCLPASRGNGTPPDPGYNKFFKCSQSGTTGTAEPVWTTGANQTDGTAKWDYVAAPTTAGNPVEQIMQNILDDHKASSDPTVTLYTPTSPSWGIRQYIQRREFVLDAVKALAQQIGWDLRYKWRSGTGQFEFTFFAPERTSPGVNFTFAVTDYADPTRLAVDIANIRNAWRVLYSDRADLFPDGTPKRKVIEVSDATSITRYGELWAEIQEDSNSNIDSSTEATALANAALADCKEPTAVMSVPLTRGFPWVEVSDYYTFTANGLHFDTNQSLAVTGWTQSFEAGKSLKTTLEMRGLPTIGSAGWIGISVHPNIAPVNVPPLRQHFQGTDTNTVILTPVVGGVTATAASAIDKNHISDDDVEIHLYTEPATTLSTTTLKAVGKTHNKASQNVGDLVPGKTYYGKTVPRSYSKGRIIRGEPSAEFSFEAGRAKTGHYDSTSTQSHLPLNGNFEHTTDPVGPPDQWAPTALPAEGAETWGVTVTLSSTTDHGNHITLVASAASRGRFLSNPFEVRRALREANFYISFRRQGSSGASKNLRALLYFYSDSACSNLVDTRTLEWSGDSGGIFPSLNTWYTSSFPLNGGLGDLPANANFCRVALQRNTTGDTSYSYDVGEVYFQEADFRALTVDALEVKEVLTVDYPAQILSNSGGVISGFAIEGSTIDDNTPITQPAWTDVTGGIGFANSFSDFGTPYHLCGYMKDSMGFVHLRGLVTRASAALNTTIFTLPAGYRPANDMNLVVTASGQSAAVYVTSAGVITVFAADAATWYTDISFESITFDTR